LKSPHALATRSALDIDFTELEEGDFVVHLQYGIGKFLGLKNLPAGSSRHPSTLNLQLSTGTECLVIEYAPRHPGDEPPKLYVPVTEAHLVGKYVGVGKVRPPLNTLGGTRWNKAKEQAERAVRDVAAELLQIQAVRESQAGHAVSTGRAVAARVRGRVHFRGNPGPASAPSAKRNPTWNAPSRWTV
jgi:transcription-repair coupling factor (superfamily II helicase)